jgi:hypothetical protein
MGLFPSSYFQHLPGKILSFIWGFIGAYAKDDTSVLSNYWKRGLSPSFALGFVCVFLLMDIK